MQPDKNSFLLEIINTERKTRILAFAFKHWDYPLDKGNEHTQILEDFEVITEHLHAIQLELIKMKY